MVSKREIEAVVEAMETLAQAICTLLKSNTELEREREELKHDLERYISIASEEATRAEAAETKLAEAMKVIGQIDNALNDQFAAGIEEREGGSARRQERLMKSGEELRRAARKFLKENENGE